MPDRFLPGGILTIANTYSPGDPPPSGYCDWHEWAAVQHSAGLRQEKCSTCGRWKYPQELSEKTVETKARTRSGQEVRVVGVVCKACTGTEGQANVQ